MPMLRVNVSMSPYIGAELEQPHQVFCSMKLGCMHK